MATKKVNKVVNIASSALSTALPSNDSPEIPAVAGTLLATFQQGLAVGLAQNEGITAQVDDPIWRAGVSAGNRIAEQAATSYASDAALWRDMVRHGVTSGRFGTSDDCRPTLVMNDEDTAAWLQALWTQAFALGANEKAKSGAQFEAAGDQNEATA